MPVRTKSEIDGNEAAESEADRKFLGELATIERERLLSALRSSGSAEGEVAPGVSGATLDQLTELATRIRLLERTAELGLLSPDGQGKELLSLYSEGKVDVMHLDTDSEFSDTPESSAGTTFLWTQTPKLEFRLPVQRLRLRYLRIRFASIIKTEYAREARLSIDGVPMTYWIGRSGSDHFFECAVPVSENLVPSRIVLEIPAVHAPSELGLSDDSRPLGIAIVAAEYSSRPEASLFSRVRARIRRSASRS